MTFRQSILSRTFQSALLAAMLLLPFAAAHAQAAGPAAGASASGAATSTGARAFWCKSPNGTAALQMESCAPGTEVRSEPVGPHGSVPKQAIASPVDPSAATSPAAVAARQVTQAPQFAPAIAVTAPGGNLGKIALVAVFMLLGLGLVVFLIRRR